jgi:START domain
MTSVSKQWWRMALATCFMGWALLATAGTDWESTGETGEGRETVRTWARSVDGMAVKAFKGVTEVHHTTPEVLSLLSDTANLHNWVFNVRQGSHLAGQPTANVYLQFKGIWPAADRDVLVKRQASQLPSGLVLVETREVDGHPEQDGYVRMRMLRNTFKLTPLPGQWTRIEFETQIDVGGLIPAWIANIVSTKAPRVTLEGIHRQINLPKYQGRTVSDLPSGFSKDGAVLKLPPEHLAN